MWEVARQLHETGQGGLLLIVEDPEQLIKKELCVASALNLPGPTRIENEEKHLGKGRHCDANKTCLLGT